MGEWGDRVSRSTFLSHTHTHIPSHPCSDAEQEKRFLDRIDTPSKVSRMEREIGTR